MLGATGHVARNLMVHLGAAANLELLLYARRPEAVAAFLQQWPCAATCTPQRIEDLGVEPIDAVINCVGLGDPATVSGAGVAVYELTDRFESLVMGHLQLHPEVRYIDFSSGAVYGTAFTAPAGDDTPAVVPVNHIGPEHHYGIAKLGAEARHRAAADLAIVDLRLFGLFSRFVDPNARYLMNDVVGCLLDGTELVTGPDDIWRDYVHPVDLAALVRAVLATDPLNDVFDVASAAPVSKFELLERFARQHGLKYAVDESLVLPAATGAKTHYYSTSVRAERIGHHPRFTAMEALVEEVAAILSREGKGAA